MKTTRWLIGCKRTMLFFDIETNGLYQNVTKAHCMVIIDQDGNISEYRPQEVHSGALRLLKALNEGELICGHNIIDYDIPVLEKLYDDFRVPRNLRQYVVDTLVLSRLLYGNIADSDYGRAEVGRLPKNLIGKQSLKAWGYRLGNLKGTYAEEHEDAWAEFNEDMLTYCVQDVQVTKDLYAMLMKSPQAPVANRLEHDIAWLMAKQERNGFPFDKEKAEKLLQVLQERSAVLDTMLRSKIPQIPDKVFIPKRDNKTKGYKKGVPIQKYKDFNPKSRKQIKWIVTEKYGYIPNNEDLFDKKGELKLDDETFDFIKDDENAPKELRELSVVFAEYLMVAKRLGQIATGEQAWLAHIGADGSIHGSVNPCGAVTGRASHSYPNVAQVPRVGNPYGKECRELFKAPDGWWQVGVDASGLELRCLAHFMYPYDGGAYAHEILNGDIHTANQKAAGLPERNQAKTFIYAFLYGAGDAKIGRIVHGDAKDGKRLKKKFLEQTPAIARLRQAITNVLVEEYHGKIVKWKRKYLKGLDGRMLHVRSLHSALNLLLQSAGALICKKWICIVEEKLVNMGYDHGKDFRFMAWVHDEYQCACRTEEIAKVVVEVGQQAIREAQEFFKFRVQLDTEGKIGRNWCDCH